MNPELLRNLPAVDKVLETEAASALVGPHARERVVDAVRRVLERCREDLREAGDDDVEVPDADALARRAADELARLAGPRLRRVVNATGVLLHTGLGRAPLADEAVEALGDRAARSCLLEVDPVTGRRGTRENCVTELLCTLSGAEAATVVNNNAAATMLAVSSVAAGREVIVSRGELVEIGGSYRVPEVISQGGAVLREVGTTNRTRIGDYRAAIGPDTGALMRVHTSNYRVVGFTAAPSLEELVTLGREHRVPVVDDLGSGCLVDLEAAGVPEGSLEPQVSVSIATGADLVCFSGDKLLGGPQAGILVGTRERVAAARRHPLFRALRPDKLVLAALEATLALYLGEGEHGPLRRVPVLRMLSESVADVRARAESLADGLRNAGAAAEAVETTARAGSGALPAVDIPSAGVAWDPEPCGLTPSLAQRRLLARATPIFVRVTEDRVWFDARTLGAGDADEVISAVSELVQRT